MVYRSVSRANPHFNRNRLTINSTHISKYTSCLFSPINMTFTRTAQLKMASHRQTTSLSVADPGRCPLHLQFYWLLSCQQLFHCILIGSITALQFYHSLLEKVAGESNFPPKPYEDYECYTHSHTHTHTHTHTLI